MQFQTLIYAFARGVFFIFANNQKGAFRKMELLKKGTATVVDPLGCNGRLWWIKLKCNPWVAHLSCPKSIWNIQNRIRYILHFRAVVLWLNAISKCSPQRWAYLIICKPPIKRLSTFVQPRCCWFRTPLRPTAAWLTPLWTPLTFIYEMLCEFNFWFRLLHCLTCDVVSASVTNRRACCDLYLDMLTETYWMTCNVCNSLSIGFGHGTSTHAYTATVEAEEARGMHPSLSLSLYVSENQIS